MVEGESGLLSCLAPESLRGGSIPTAWNRSIVELFLVNGSKLEGYSSQVPESLRGPQFDRAWCDELAAWIYIRKTWNMLMLALRLGDLPQVVVTSTPKPLKIIRELIARSKKKKKRKVDVLLTEGSTYDNIDNLADSFREEILNQFEGTRLGAQELHGEVLDDAPGALWSRAACEENRWERDKDLPDMDRIVVGVDPAVSSGPNSNETGIVAVGVVNKNCPCGHLPHLPHGFILEDRSLRGTPTEWAGQACEVYDSLEADRVVGEVNNGGELVETVIKSSRPDVSYRAVHASRGKKKRAEPVSALSDQKRLHIVGYFAELENQMCTWVPPEAVDDEALTKGERKRAGEADSEEDSPDRMDAMVWAATSAVLTKSTRRRIVG